MDSLNGEIVVVKRQNFNIKARLKRSDNHFSRLEEKVDLLTNQTEDAVKTLTERLDSMDKKLDENIVAKYEVDFIWNKIHFLEREIFKLKQP